MSVATAEEQFISGNQAKTLLGWGWNSLYKAVMNGDIRSRKIPGKRDLRYYREDVERLRGELGEHLSRLQPGQSGSTRRNQRRKREDL
jgi:hypothetical protein